MRVLLSGAFEFMDVRVGFGNASYYIYKTLKNQGVDVIVKEPDDSFVKADIEICFNQPHNYQFISNGYKIGYTPWESSDFFPGWHEKMNECDEIWATSYWNKSIFEYHFPDKEIFVYQHGIDPVYKSMKRKLNPKKPFTFLYIGEPSARKNGIMVAQTFIKLYGNNPEYKLIIKGVNESSIKIQGPMGGEFEADPAFFYKNIYTILDSYQISKMVKLYQNADVFLYPSWGEGWGFNPFQAIATGLPTISTYKWADYQDLIPVHVDSVPELSPWQDIHPGYMLKPSYGEFKAGMAQAKDNYELLADITYQNAIELHERYSWDKVTQPAVERLQKIYNCL
jgi:glycosyltransferase involved in cell wall biosynthesis